MRFNKIHGKTCNKKNISENLPSLGAGIENTQLVLDKNHERSNFNLIDFFFMSELIKTRIPIPI